MKNSKTHQQVKTSQTKAIADFVKALSPEHQRIVEQLRDIIFRSATSIEESIKWNMLCYFAAGNVCYIASYKEHINFGFYKGAEIMDPEKLLVGSGKNLRHIKIHEKVDIRVRAFTQLIKQAVRLNHG